VVFDGGRQYVLFGGQAVTTTLRARGHQSILDGGAASGTVISNGYQWDYGSASGTVISRGAQYVSNGGVASDTTVVGGFQRVLAGGSADGTVVSLGGIEYLGSGGTISNLTLSSGGRLDFATVAFGGGTALNFDSGSDTLSISSGSHSASVSLFGQYVAGGFTTVGDGHGGTMVTYSATSGPGPSHIAPAHA